ncbi:MAG: hypothetical protein EBU69_05450 [Methylophilaceae bacterium]|jgi:septal ring factor EnvC (AmiA/AmiB activator)|nr:hypothetical protein [Methylophilaceae bacterium]
MKVLTMLLSKKPLFFVLALSLLSPLSLVAKDISDEQYQVRMAQKEYDKALRDQELTAQQIQEIEKRIAQQSTQLEALKKALPAKQERLDKAKSALDEKTKILDKVWEENKK